MVEPSEGSCHGQGTGLAALVSLIPSSRLCSIETTPVIGSCLPTGRALAARTVFVAAPLECALPKRYSPVYSACGKTRVLHVHAPAVWLEAFSYRRVLAYLRFVRTHQAPQAAHGPIACHPAGHAGPVVFSFAFGFSLGAVAVVLEALARSWGFACCGQAHGPPRQQSRLVLRRRNAAGRRRATDARLCLPAGQPAPKRSPAGTYKVYRRLVRLRLRANFNAISLQQLYFYALACSPTEEESRSRKARLRYQQPPATSADYGYAVQTTVPMVVQSACASPHELPARQHTALPHFSEIAWDRPPQVQQYQQQQQQQQQHHHHQHHQQQVYRSPEQMQSGVPSAPFANAGPPGVQFYINNNVQQPTPEYNWARSRRL